MIPLSEIADKEIEWLWKGRIAYGTLTTLEGDGGISKSLVTYGLAARVSAGRFMPMTPIDPTQVIPCQSVLMFQAEDNASVAKSRVEAAGGDLKRILLFNRGSALRSLILPEQAEVMRKAIKDHAARLVIIDPLSSYVTRTLNSQLRRKAHFKALSYLRW
jgi:hypothetical protein